MKTIKRKIVIAVLILVLFLLETTVCPKIALGGIMPNLTVILVSSFGFMRGKKEGLFIGFFSGLLFDIFFGKYTGMYALLYMVIGYINGFFKRLFYDEDVKLPLALIGASEFFYGIIVYVLWFMLKSDFDFGFYFWHIIMPELVYTILVTLVLYRIILVINRKLEDEEKRSASKFV